MPAPAVPVTPLTPVMLSLLTNQKNPGVEAYTPRTRGLHAELQSWLSPLLGDEEEPERKPPVRLPSMDEQAAADLPVPTAAPSAEEARSESFRADPLNSSQVTAEAALESLLLTVVNESDAKFKDCTGDLDLSTDLKKLDSDCEKQLKAAFSQKQPSYAEIRATLAGHIGRIRATAAEHVADLTAGYDAARKHMRTFGVEHLLEVWAEAAASCTAKATLNAQELSATIERVRESEGGARMAARTARKEAGEAANAVALLRAEIAQLNEKLQAETTRANAAESVLIKKFEQMDELSEASTSCSRRLLHKVEALEAAWKAECQKSNRLEIALRKLNGEREAQAAKLRPPGKGETPKEFAAKVQAIHKEVDEVRGRVAQIVKHQASIRQVIEAIRRGASHDRAAPAASPAAPAAGLAPSPPQSKQPTTNGARRPGGRQLSVTIPQAQAVGGSGRVAKRTPSWQDRPSARGKTNGRGSGITGGGHEVDARGSGSAARLTIGLAWQDGAGALNNGQLSSRTRQPALSLTSSRRLAAQQ